MSFGGLKVTFDLAGGGGKYGFALLIEKDGGFHSECWSTGTGEALTLCAKMVTVFH